MPSSAERRTLPFPTFLSILVLTLLLAAPAWAAENIRGATTGPTTAKGYNHPNQYVHLQPTQIAPNMEPVIPHADQDKEARAKLDALRKKTGKKPNILIVVLDDVGWMDPGFNGGGVAVGNATPNMDKLASEGLVLTSAYSQPSCSPTRATILTGQLPCHHGVLYPPMYGQPGGLDGAVTIAQLLRDQGYVTQGVGKWHMGENDGSLPQNVGFDDFYGFLSVSDMYSEWRDVYFNPEIALSPDRFAAMQKLPFNPNVVHCEKGGCKNVRLIDLNAIKDLDEDWLTYSENFIRKMAKNPKPFFLYHGTRGCHFDNYPSDRYAGKSAARTVYSDCMVEMDDVVGRLVKTLEETGQLENTLVFFTSDNGPEGEVDPYGRTPFRGYKGTTWEGGVRVPTFVYWKGMITPGKSEGLFDLADLFPTALSLAGVSGADIGKLVPKDRYIDGIDQASFLLGDQKLSNRRSVLYWMMAEFAAVRMDEFKLHRVVQITDGINTKGWNGGFSGTVTKTGGVVMYNLYANPQEDASVGIRHLPIESFLEQEMKRYAAVLKKFPPKFDMARR